MFVRNVYLGAHKKNRKKIPFENNLIINYLQNWLNLSQSSADWVKIMVIGLHLIAKELFMAVKRAEISN